MRYLQIRRGNHVSTIREQIKIKCTRAETDLPGAVTARRGLNSQELLQYSVWSSAGSSDKHLIAVPGLIGYVTGSCPVE